MTTSASALRLDADPRAAQQARAFVADVLGGPSELVEIAQLLVSELVTNAVVHAASALDVEVMADEDGATIRVRDADTGPLVMPRHLHSELDEGGRGLMLIAQLADAWGTEHRGGRKTVWFRLGADPAVGDSPAPPEPTGGSLRVTERRLRTLLLRSQVQRALTFEHQLGELLARIMDALGAPGATLLAAAGDELASRGQVHDLPSKSCPLVLDDRTVGQLLVYVDRPLDDEDEAFLSIAAQRLALLTSEHGVSHAERERAAGLDYLTEATELLTSSLSVSLSLTLVAQIVVPRLGDWCAIYSVEDQRRPQRLTSNHRIEDRTDALNAMLAEDREINEAIATVAAGGSAQRLPGTVSVAGQRNAVAVAPLASRGRTLGVAVVGRREPLDAVGFMALLELGRRAALAVDNARLHEEQVAAAQALQTSLLPSALPVIDGVEFGARYHSASPGMSVGGDFYDAFRLADGSFVVAIGDVCGKGAEAAAITGMSRDLLRLLIQDGNGLAASLRRLNRALLENADNQRFCTVALARAVPRDDGLDIAICLAGHPEPVVLRRDHSTAIVGVPGDLLGVMPDEIELTEQTCTLSPGDALVFYTDGITERRDHATMFGQTGLRHALETARDADAEGVAAAVERAARTFVDSELRDDLAVLVVRCSTTSTATTSTSRPAGS